MEVKAARGPRTTPAVSPAAKEPPPWDKEQWVDEGPIRDAATGAAARGRAVATEPVVLEKTPRTRTPGDLDPEVVAEVEREAGASKAGRYRERLTAAAEALERGRYDDARRMVQPVLRDLPNVAMAHEIAGLSWYCTGQWRKAAVELELARQLDRSVRHHPVLADCYRAMKRYGTVDELWKELKAASPEPSLMAEGRIVAAGSLADQGDLRGALSLMSKAREVPKKVRDHHLRQWYVIADLLDRSGEVVEARRYFSLVAQADSEFADVMQRLATLGR
jgi:tetratricopeptide (TPR) repeat protein